MSQRHSQNTHRDGRRRNDGARKKEESESGIGKERAHLARDVNSGRRTLSETVTIKEETALVLLNFEAQPKKLSLGATRPLLFHTPINIIDGAGGWRLCIARSTLKLYVLILV